MLVNGQPFSSPDLRVGSPQRVSDSTGSGYADSARLEARPTSELNRYLEAERQRRLDEAEMVRAQRTARWFAAVAIGVVTFVIAGALYAIGRQAGTW